MKCLEEGFVAAWRHRCPHARAVSVIHTRTMFLSLRLSTQQKKLKGYPRKCCGGRHTVRCPLPAR